MYAFLWVLAAGGAVALIKANRKWAYAVIALIAFQAVSSARAYPAYMAYANEMWGGPSQTYKYLSDSNSDWGQQLKSVKKYLDARGVKDCWFIYFGEGVIDTKYYGIPCKPLPTADSLWVNEKIEAPPAVDGPVLISAGDLSGFEYGPGALNPYAQFQSLKPTAVIDYGVFVFDGHFEIPLASAKSHIQTAGPDGNEAIRCGVIAGAAGGCAGPRQCRDECSARRCLDRTAATGRGARRL